MTTREEVNCRSNFLSWLNGWDLSIESLDDRESQVEVINVIEEANLLLENHCNEWEEKCLENDLKNGTNSYIKLIESEKHKNFKRVAKNLLHLRYKISDVFEIKNRRTKEIFNLKSEIAKSKINYHGRKY